MNKPLRYIRRDAVTSEMVDFQELYIAYSGKKQMLSNIRKLEKDIRFLKTLDAYAGISYILKVIGYESCNRLNTGNVEKWREQEEIFKELKNGQRSFQTAGNFWNLLMPIPFTSKKQQRTENRRNQERGSGL